MEIRDVENKILYSDESLTISETLENAVKARADLTGANLTRALLPTSESWEDYLAEVVPALLTAGGKTLAEVATPEHWNYHTWDNCPMAAAFCCNQMDAVPALYRPRAEQFIQFFDAGLIPRPGT